MAEKKKDQMACSCSTGMCACGMSNHYGFRILRAFFVLAVMVIVFVLGVKIGELRGWLEASYGRGRMMGRPSYAGQYYPMTQNVPGTTTPAATSTGQ